MTVARRRGIDAGRRRRTAADALADLALVEEDRMTIQPAEGPGDVRLGLLYACAAPEVPVPVRAPLMLQAVLGVDVRRMAGAFLVPPATLGQRLTRAKRRLGRSAFAIPAPDEAPDRTADVLAAIYAACALGQSGDANLAGLGTEALWLASLVAAALPDDAEAHGLFALILFAEARRPAARVAGRFVPLTEQDTALWDARLLADARAALRHTSGRLTLGRFQIEAAI